MLTLHTTVEVNDNPTVRVFLPTSLALFRPLEAYDLSHAAIAIGVCVMGWTQLPLPKRTQVPVANCPHPNVLQLHIK